MRDANGAGGDPTDIMQQAIQKILKTLKADEFLALMQDPGAIARGVQGPPPQGPMTAQPLTEGMGRGLSGSSASGWPPNMPAQPLTQGMAPHQGYTSPGGGGGMAGPPGGGDRGAKLKALFNMMGTGGAGPR